MVPNRSILLVTLPSLALILGFVWLRRKKSGVHCDTGGNNNKGRLKDSIAAPSNNNKTAKLASPNKLQGIREEVFEEEIHAQDLKRSQSLPCAPQGSPSRDSADRVTGKSAPIAIAPNPRSPPIKVTETQLDSEILKLKLEESDYKNLLAIKELEDDSDTESPVDLPGTIERRRRYQTSFNANGPEQPVVIKASMTAKVSPKGSFAESNNNGIVRNDSPVDVNANKDEKIGVEEDHHDENEARNTPVASPPLSLCSIRSTDSGKGSSPPHSEGDGGAVTSIYEFVVPVNAVPQLIGRKGNYVNQLKSKTGVNLIVKKHPTINKQKICSLEGTQKEIDAALKMIRAKLPEKRYPTVTLERVFLSHPNSVIPLPAIDTSLLHMHLIEGINNDVVISSIMSGGHVFLQQPLHPSYPQLNVLQMCMNQSYSVIETPNLLQNIVEDAVCAAPILAPDNTTNWYRVQIISHNPETETCLVKYLDYGGYVSVYAKDLRQIRTDFMTVPFQATECLLSNIKPTGLEWVPEASEVLYSLTSGIVLQAQVAGYSQDGLPEVYLYACFAKDNVVFINQELVARGLAEWVPTQQQQDVV
ncbi:A-kinase anchor protein 1, mitochondrial [Culicoides brevitarsis]|uniref:A-kinase anchor protein 1, mitochondrial n=1 Tax=Culicoides brevitarsis TaxID=469753 RepID=UPI00307BBAA5